MLAIAAGGDGLVGGVIAHLAASGLPLGILPLGTANDIARSLRIPQNLSQAVEVIAQGHTRPIDIGTAQPIDLALQQLWQEPTLTLTVPPKQACFAHALTVGLNVQFARIATNVATRQRFGHLAYPVAALEAMRTHEALEVELHFDGLSFPSAQRSIQRPTRTSPAPIDAVPVLRCHALQVTVVNTPFFGGRWQIAVPAASYSDRLLDIVVIEERSTGYLNKRLADFFHPEGHVSARPTRTHASYPTRHSAELTGIPGIHHLQARGVTINTNADPKDATIDGEVRVQTPLLVQVADEPLNVVVPTMAEQQLAIRS
jgi:diacylglycerol kinase (ATP)